MEHDASLCARIDNDLSLYVGGELDSAAERELTRHLGVCAVCRRRSQAAHAAHRARLAVLHGVEGPAPDLWPGLRAVLVREGLLRAEPARWVTSRSVAPRSSRRAQTWTLAAAAAVLVLCGTWAVRSWLESETGSGAGDPAPIAWAPPKPDANTAVLPSGEGRLRPLARGERALQDGALVLGNDEARMSIVGPPPDQMDVPAGQMQLRPRRR